MTREEELKELAELEELEELEKLNAQEEKFKAGQTHFINPETNRTEPIPQDQLPPSEPSVADSLMLGGVEGIPFAKDILSAGEAAFESITSEGASFGESFARNKAELDEAINEAEIKNPNAFLTGDIAAGFATPVGSIKGLKGITKLGMFGAASGLSRSEDRDVWDAVGGAGLSIGGQAVMKPVISTARLVGEKLGALSANSMHNILVGSGARDKINAVVRKYFVNKDGKLSDGIQSFSDFISTKKVGDEFVIRASDTSDVIHRKASTWVEQAGKRFDKALSTTSEVVDVDSNKVFNKIQAQLGIDDMLNSASEEIKQKGQKYLGILKNEFYEQSTKTEKIVEEVASGLTDSKGNPIMKKVEKFIEVPQLKMKKLDLKGLNDIKKGWAEQSNIKVLDGIPQNSLNAEMYGNLTKSITENIHNVVDGAGKLSKPLREYSKDFAVASLVASNTKKLADTEKLGAVDAVRKLLQTRGAMFSAIAAGSIVGGSSGSIGVGLTTALGLGLASTMVTRTASTRLHAATRTLSQNLTNPNYAKHLNKLTVAAGVSSDAFREELASTLSKIALQDNKIPRSMEGVLESSEEILNILNNENKDIANQFRKALEKGNEDEIGALFSAMSKMDGAEEFIQEGMGFNGKVYDPNDVKQLESQVANSDISAMQKAQHLKNLREGGIIPQIQTEPDRFFDYKKRNKRKPAF